MRPATVALALALAASSAPGQDTAQSGIVYGKDHAFLIRPPAGWVLDTRSGQAQGLHAVFYPRGSGWLTGPVVMYVNAARKEDGASGGVEALIAEDLARLKKHSPDVRASRLPALKTQDGRTAVVRLFEGDQWGNREAVAYIEEKKIVSLVVLSARTKEQYEAARPAFDALVASYAFISDAVRPPPPPPPQAPEKRSSSPDA